MKRLVQALSALTCAGLLAGCMNIVFSPDGKTIAFPWSEGESGCVATIGIDGQGFRFLSGTLDHEPVAWSPDGARLLTLRTDRETVKESLHVHNLAAQRSRKLLEDVSGPVLWAGSSDKIIAGQSTDGIGRLVWFDLVTNREHLRLDLSIGFGDPPDACYLPSSDGIAFIGSDDNVHAVLRGVPIKITTTGDVVGLTANAQGNRLTWARKSRNPKYILLSLYRYDLDKRTVQKLPFPDRVAPINPSPRQGPDEVSLVRFSPNGSEMAVLCQMDRVAGKSPPHNVYRVRLDGNSAWEVGPMAPETAAFALNWSPDGSRLATIEAGDKTATLALYGAGKERKVLRTVVIPSKD